MNTLGIPPDALGLGASLVIGLLIGLERGWQTRDLPSGARVAGLRTFALTGLLGGVLGLVWSPCSGPLLASALALVVSEGGAVSGAIILGAFGVGAALPLVGVAYASRSGFERWRDRALRSMDGVKKGFGALLGLAGVAILMGWDKALEAWALDHLPEAWTGLSSMI